MAKIVDFPCVALSGLTTDQVHAIWRIINAQQIGGFIKGAVETDGIIKFEPGKKHPDGPTITVRKIKEMLATF